MFEDNKGINSLSDKVLELIIKYKELKNENEALRSELVSLRAKNEAINLQLVQLEDNIVAKNLTEDELFKQIENVLAE